MICPLCNTSTKIYNSRSSHQKSQTWRRHRCTNNHLFTTREKADWTGATTVVTSDDTAPYSRERLLLSLVRASSNFELPPEMLGELCDSIELQMQRNHLFLEPTIQSDLIIQITTTVTAAYNRNLALQYVNGVYNDKPPLHMLKQLVNA